MLGSSQSDSTAFPSLLDTYATRLLAEPLSFCNLLLLRVAVRRHPSIDVFQTDDIILIELTEGYLKYSDCFVSDGREPVCRPTRNDDSLPPFWPENPTLHLDLGSGIEDHP